MKVQNVQNPKLLKNAVCLHKLEKISSNAQLSFDKLIINQRDNLLNLAFCLTFYGKSA